MQREAVVAIKKAGGWVVYERELPASDWTGRILGDDFLRNVVAVSYNWHGHTSVITETETGVRYVSPVPVPTRWDFGDDDAKHLMDLPGLTSLDLSNTRLTDAGLRNIEGFTCLETLALTNTEVSDTGLEALASLTRLEELCIGRGTDPADGFGNISLTEPSAKQITDAGVVHISKATHLRDLWIGSTQVTDTGLEHIGRLTKLENLFVGGVEITDAGLMHLRNLTSLRKLILYNTQVTPEGVKKLQEALPNCTIEY